MVSLPAQYFIRRVSNTRLDLKSINSVPTEFERYMANVNQTVTTVLTFELLIFELTVKL
jgi:hypothetical protein